MTGSWQWKRLGLEGWAIEDCRSGRAAFENWQFAEQGIRVLRVLGEGYERPANEDLRFFLGRVLGEGTVYDIFACFWKFWRLCGFRVLVGGLLI